MSLLICTCVCVCVCVCVGVCVCGCVGVCHQFWCKIALIPLTAEDRQALLKDCNKLCCMETSREELLAGGDGEVDSTTEDSPIKKPQKQRIQQKQIKKARLDSAYERAKEIFTEQNLSDSDTEDDLFACTKLSFPKKKLESSACGKYVT